VISIASKSKPVKAKRLGKAILFIVAPALKLRIHLYMEINK
jgi:hypothetical protein